MTLPLRPYQQRAVDRLVASTGNPLLIAPTGSGKTVMLAAAARHWSDRGEQIWVLTHRRELVYQLETTFHAFGVNAWYSTWQSCRSVPDPCDRLIVDEAHHIAPGTRYAALIAEAKALNPRIQIVGATATPWRLDGLGLTEFFDDPIIAATPRELLDQGVLVPYTGFAYRNVETADIRKVAGDYAQGALGEAAQQPQLLGDIVTRWKQTASGLSTLAFAVNIEHAAALTKEFQSQGVNAEYLTGEDTMQRRDELFAKLATRSLSVLVNVAIATEGVDIPSLECLILARPTLSETLALQMIGRVLRSYRGKNMARIHDHAQIIQTHGSPYAERDWSPSPTRRRGPSEGGGSQQICHACLALISASARTCSVCGEVLRERSAVAASDGIEVAIGSDIAMPDARGNFEGPYPGRKAFPAISMVLDRALAPIPIGTPIRVRYLGERTSHRGLRYHDYRVERLQTLSPRELELLSGN